MSTAASPFASVVVPTHKRSTALARCVDSLAALSYPRERFEVILVDDGGHGVATVLEGARAQCLTITSLAVPQGGPAAARNAGAAAANGDVLAFIDDDCTADPGWLDALTRTLASNPDAAVGGRVVNALPDNPFSQANHTLLDFLYQYYHVERRGLLPFFTTNNLAVRAEVFRSLGGFDASFPFASEDRDWSDRCRHAGHPLVYAPGAIVHHAPSLDFPGFVRQHLRYGEGAWRFHRARARRHRRRVGLESPRFYGGMLAAPFTRGEPAPLRQSLLLLLSQAASAVGFAAAAVRPASHRGHAGGPS